MKIIRTDAVDERFISLVKQLDADLAERDGRDHDFYNQYNGISDIKYAVIALMEEQPVGCGAIKQLHEESAEVKRMYTLPAQRGKQVASNILSELETWAAELGFTSCMLETGKKQPEAIALYKKSGYNIIPNYGQYAGVDNSVCFEKKL